MGWRRQTDAPDWPATITQLNSYDDYSHALWLSLLSFIFVFFDCKKCSAADAADAATLALTPNRTDN
jgi:hypothetical protein